MIFNEKKKKSGTNKESKIVFNSTFNLNVFLSFLRVTTLQITEYFGGKPLSF